MTSEYADNSQGSDSADAAVLHSKILPHVGTRAAQGLPPWRKTSNSGYHKPQNQSFAWSETIRLLLSFCPSIGLE